MADIPTMYESTGFTININQPLWLGGSFEHTLSDFSAYRHSVRAAGGYWDASFSIRGEIDTMEEWAQHGLGRHIVVKGPDLSTIWEGVVNKITITAGPLSTTIGPLLEVYNRVAAVYSEVDTATGSSTYGEKKLSSILEDFDSQERFGIISNYMSISNTDAASADQIMETQLNESAWPQIIHDISSTTHEPNVVVDCVGYVRWLERVVYTQTEIVGDVTLEEKLKSVICSEPNGFFELSDIHMFKEVVTNGNFEVSGAGGADIYANWTENAGDGILADVSSDHAVGSHCVSLTAGPSVDTYIYQNITVVPEQAYRLTFETRDLSIKTLTGNHTGGNNEDRMTELGADFVDDWVRIGQRIDNNTDGSHAIISAVTHNQVWGELQDGNDNDWDLNDAFTITINPYMGRYQVYDRSNGADIISLTDTNQYGSQSWRKVERIFYAPEGCTQIRLLLFCPDTDGKQVYFDAVSVKEYSAEIAENTTLVPTYEDEYRDAWTIIKELLQYGDYENNLYNFGVYGDREIIFEQRPTDEEYMISIRDVGRGYRDVSGNVIDPWNMLPGKWLKVNDIFFGIDYGVFRKNPSMMFIDEVRYSAGEGLTINPGKTGTVLQALAKLGLEGL